MKKQNKKVIIILGPPGSGKGTQVELLAEKFNLYHWDTSKIIGKMIKEAKKGAFIRIEGKKYYFEKERKMRTKGLLWDPPFIIYCVKEKIQQLAKEREGIAMTGSPRTLYEGQKLIPFLKKLYGAKNVKITILKLSEKESIWRNTHRRECELIRHPILYTKETAKLTKCPLDGSKLVSRMDDVAEIIKIRLKEFREKTLPVIELFKKQGLKVKTVNGEQSVADVFKDILKALK